MLWYLYSLKYLSHFNYAAFICSIDFILSSPRLFVFSRQISNNSRFEFSDWHSLSFYYATRMRDWTWTPQGRAFLHRTFTRLMFTITWTIYVLSYFVEKAWFLRSMPLLLLHLMFRCVRTFIINWQFLKLFFQIYIQSKLGL